MKQNALWDTRWRLFVSKIRIYLPLVNYNVSQSKTETSAKLTVLFLWRKQSSDKKEMNTVFKHLLRPKNTQVPEDMEGEIKMAEV